MKLKQISRDILLTGFLSFFCLLSLGVYSQPVVVNAEPRPYTCPDGTGVLDGTPCPEGGNSLLIEDEGRDELSGLKNNKGCDPADGEPLSKENCSIVQYLVIGINVLSAIAGMAIIASIMIAGFQYMTAQDNAGQIEQAKKRIISAIVALLVFIFMYALLDFFVPGGVL